MDQQLGAVLDLAGQEAAERLNIGANRQSLISNIINNKRQSSKGQNMYKRRSEYSQRYT